MPYRAVSVAWGGYCCDVRQHTAGDHASCHGPTPVDDSARGASAGLTSTLLARLRPFHDAVAGGEKSGVRRPRPLLMGVINVTPDSFSDGGQTVTAEAVAEQMREMCRAGADVIDIGAESTRPGAQRVPASEQLRRLEAVLEVLRRSGPPGVPLTVDTTRADVAEAALDAGFSGVNDVSGGRDDPRVMDVVAEKKAVYVLMHMRGEPATMQTDPQYGPEGVVSAVARFLLERRKAAEAAGIPREHLLGDVGIGFGKTDAHNLQLLKHLQEIERVCGLPQLVGTSRKGFLGRLTGRAEPSERVWATAATVAWAALCGAAVVRVHDVAAMRDVLVTWEAIDRADEREAP